MHELHHRFMGSISICPGGLSNTSVIHMCDQRNVKKRVVFFRLNTVQENHDWGSKCACFQEKGSFLNSIRRCLQAIFQTLLFHKLPPSPNKKKSCLRGKIGCETAQNYLLRYVLKTSGYAYVQYWYSSTSRTCIT